MSLSRGQLRTLALASLGGALEFYDFVIFVFFATTMGILFFPADMPEWMRLAQTFGIFGAGYLARPLGGIVLAHFGDMRGRKRMFMLSILLMAVPTLLMGLLPTYATAGALAPILLLLLRIMQGAAIGGEAPGAWVFVSEHVSPRHRALACGMLSAGLLGGILLGSLVAAGLDALLAPAQLAAWGWRIPFVFGGLLGFVALYIRRRLHETPVFTELQARRALATELPLRTVLRAHRPAVVRAMLLTWLLTAAVVVAILMPPALLPQWGIARDRALAANAVAIACAMLGNLVAGTLADRHGEGPVLIAWSALLGVAFWLFQSLVPQHPQWLLPLYALLGFAVGLTALVPSIAVAGFPAAVRFSGLSFAYNVAYAICGGLTPALLTLAIHADPAAATWYLAGMGLLGCALGAWAWWRGGTVASRTRSA